MAVFTGNGSQGSPSFTFSSDNDTGFYRYGDGTIGVTLNGQMRARFQGSALNISSSDIVPSSGAGQDLKVYGISGQAGLFVGRWNSAGDGCVNDFFSNRSAVIDGFIAPTSGDELCRLRFFTHDTTAYREAASITALVGTYTGTDNVGGEIQFNTRPTGAAAINQLRATVTEDGYFRMASSTGGIQFNGDTAADNALDDYEEGTWTAAYSSTTGTFSTLTYNYQTGYYVKVGKQVTVWLDIRTSNVVLGTASGNLRITGFPYAPDPGIGNHEGIGATIGAVFANANATPMVAVLGNGATEAFVAYVPNANGGGIVNEVPVSAMTTGASAFQNAIEFCMSYFTS